MNKHYKDAHSMVKYRDENTPVKKKDFEPWFVMHGVDGGAAYIRCGAGFQIADLIDKLLDCDLATFVSANGTTNFQLNTFASACLLDNGNIFPLIVGTRVECLAIRGNA
jgi:hypothetical protein